VNGPGRVPSNFESLRWRWEWGHAVHAALLFLAFLALLTSVLMDVPARTRAARAPRVAGERAA
jgi:hypothetical protein